MTIFYKIHFLNAWIFVIPVWLIGIIVANANSKGVKRATDMSWYTTIDKFASFGSMILMIIYMLVSLFIPIDLSSFWFYLGLPFILIGFVGHIAAKISYGNTKPDYAVTEGIYKFFIEYQ